MLERLGQDRRVGLRRFVDGPATNRKCWFRTYAIGGDATARQLVAHIAALVNDRS